jgi:hypothetical protein
LEQDGEVNGFHGVTLNADNHSANSYKGVHDVCLVWALEIQKLASMEGDP